MPNRVVLFGGNKYISKIRATLPFAYWPLNEISGTTARDASNHGYNGAYGGTYTLGGATGPDGRKTLSLAGAGFVNVYSTAFRDAFPGAEVTVNAWAQVSAVGIWTDGLVHMICNFLGGANDSIFLRKTATNNVASTLYQAGGTSKTRNITSLSTTGWMMISVTASKANDRTITYYNGAQFGVTQTGLGTWGGTLSATGTVLGAYDTTPTLGWSGNIAHIAVWSRELSAAEILSLYST